MINFKKTLLVILIIISYSVFSNAQKNELTGKWENEKYKVSYTFKKDSSIIFTQGSSSVFISSYTLDKSKKPAWIDFTIKRGNKSMLIPALIEFIDEKTIKIEQFPPYSTHPTEFSDQESNGIKSVYILKRAL